MRFTERDGRLLRWINGHGFVTLRQAARWLGTNVRQRRGGCDCSTIIGISIAAGWFMVIGRTG